MTTITTSNNVTTYKFNGKIKCYIRHYENKHIVCTGKPSDATCISWTYDNLEDAKFTATEYFADYTNSFELKFIQDAFKRCHGLKSYFVDQYKKGTKFINNAIEMVSEQSGVSVKFISQNINVISVI